MNSQHSLLRAIVKTPLVDFDIVRIVVDIKVLIRVGRHCCKIVDVASRKDVDVER